nr:dehydration-responsive element-binding factor 1 [Tanacetum cinerariifolium]
MVPELFYLEYEGIIAYTLWMAMQWQVSLMLVLKKKTVLRRRIWVYILMFKHEAFEKFKEWKQLVENQTGKVVKKLRTGKGLEFCNLEFEQLCIESGIARHLTFVGMPQQNRVAEHMNKTLMDKMRDLLIQHGCAAALEVLPADMEAQTKAELNKKAHIAVILCLGRSACLNFADSLWRLPVPESSNVKDIQKAAVKAAEAFRPVENDDVTLSEGSNELKEIHVIYMDDDVVFGTQGFFADLAEGLMLPPPRSDNCFFDDVELNVDVPLWSF